MDISFDYSDLSQSDPNGTNGTPTPMDPQWNRHSLFLLTDTCGVWPVNPATIAMIECLHEISHQKYKRIM